MMDFGSVETSAISYWGELRDDKSETAGGKQIESRMEKRRNKGRGKKRRTRKVRELELVECILIVWTIIVNYGAIVHR